MFATGFGVVLFNNTLLGTLPIGVRMVLLIVSCWLLMLVPELLMRISEERFLDWGFSRRVPFRQVGVGLGIAIGMSVVLTVLPILLGFKGMVGNGYTQAWHLRWSDCIMDRYSLIKTAGTGDKCQPFCSA